MKNKFIIPSLLIVLSLAACSKKDKKQYSTWTVNGETFSSNNVQTDIGKARIDLICSDANRFGLTFNVGYELPTMGNLGIEHNSSGQSPDSVSIGFYKGTVFYIISPFSSAYVSASSVNSKARYTLLPTWFINYQIPTDSVLISGEFNEP